MGTLRPHGFPDENCSLAERWTTKPGFPIYYCELAILPSLWGENQLAILEGMSIKKERKELNNEY